MDKIAELRKERDRLNKEIRVLEDERKNQDAESFVGRYFKFLNVYVRPYRTDGAYCKAFKFETNEPGWYPISTEALWQYASWWEGISKEEYETAWNEFLHKLHDDAVRYLE